MVYRILADLSIPDPEDATFIYGQIKAMLSKAVWLAPPGQEPTPSFVSMHKCHHDESDMAPCEDMETVETAPKP